MALYLNSSVMWLATSTLYSDPYEISPQRYFRNITFKYLSEINYALFLRIFGLIFDL